MTAENKVHILHLSDLHYRLNWEENQELVLNAFFEDLELQLRSIQPSKLYLFFSGDFILAGEDRILYDAFITYFNEKLNKLGIDRLHRICVPGNHDVSRKEVEKYFFLQNGIIKQELNETDFNNFVRDEEGSNIFKSKFENYAVFENEFAGFGLKGNLYANGFSIGEYAVFCLNTAIFSFGGYKNIDDKGRLCIDTRAINKWIANNKGMPKVLIMHHPIAWLTEWAQKELSKIIKTDFILVLSGHLHDQSTLHEIIRGTSVIHCSAPALLTSKSSKLGYSIIELNNNAVESIQYRQWTKNNSFHAGVEYADDDSGKIVFVTNGIKQNLTNEQTNEGLILKAFKELLDKSLEPYSSQPIVWVDRSLSINIDSELEDEDTPNKLPISPLSILPIKKSYVVKAPPQFGLTCLSFYFLVKEWEQNKSFGCYIDIKESKPHNVVGKILSFASEHRIERNNISFIVCDSYEPSDYKILKKVIDDFPLAPIILMHTVDDTKLTVADENEKIEREFEHFHLLPLKRNDIRKIIVAVSELSSIGDENVALAKIANDLELINAHRSPYNVFTLLKAAENTYDNNPVNRTELIHNVLFLLFNVDTIPDYKTRPDLKDCEYVLGRFCEAIVKGGNMYFTRQEFIQQLNIFCKERLLDLEVELVFDVLERNHIIIRRYGSFCFRSSFWVYYFAAHRMYQNDDFENWVLSDLRHASFPELIEFYTGIDRSRAKAISILTENIRKTHDIVRDNVGLLGTTEFYKMLSWEPSKDQLDKVSAQIIEDVAQSKLPDVIKDQYADNGYDATQPYNQAIRTVFEEYSLSSLWQSIKSASRALRNSDYVDPNLKRQLLNEIVNAYEQISKVMLVLAPALSAEGQASIEGQSFYLSKGFNQKDPDDRLLSVLMAVTFNVIKWFKNDISSHKIGSLLIDHLETQTDNFRRHQVATLICNIRPRNWKLVIEKYIIKLNANSYYLFDIFRTVRVQYAYSFSSALELKEFEYLIKMIVSKHQTGLSKPGLDKIVKVSNSVLPKRDENTSH